MQIEGAHVVVVTHVTAGPAGPTNRAAHPEDQADPRIAPDAAEVAVAKDACLSRHNQGTMMTFVMCVVHPSTGLQNALSGLDVVRII